MKTKQQGYRSYCYVLVTIFLAQRCCRHDHLGDDDGDYMVHGYKSSSSSSSFPHQQNWKKKKRRRRETRYFTIESDFQPLKRIRRKRSSSSSTTTTTTTTSHHGGEIPRKRRSTTTTTKTATTTTTSHAGVGDNTDDVPLLNVLYTNDPLTVSQWLANNIPGSGYTCLGFDVESQCSLPWLKVDPSAVGPATVQLSTPESSIVVQLVRSNGRRSEGCRPILEAVMQDEFIIKAGCGIDDDMLELSDHWKYMIKARSRLELCTIRLPGTKKGRTPGLKTLCRTILGVDLPKPKSMAISDWIHVPLSSKQVEYCARDAWAGAAIVQRLEQHDNIEFDSQNLARRLSSQRSLVDVIQSREIRKESKNRLRRVLCHRNERIRNGLDVTPLTTKRIHDLKTIIKENQPEFNMQLVDLDEIGFDLVVPL